MDLYHILLIVGAVISIIMTILQALNKLKALKMLGIVAKGVDIAKNHIKDEHKNEDGKFASPDPENELDYPHARLAQLFASDIVDQPASNPGGFFSEGDDLTARASAAVDYLFGRTEVEPMPGTFGRKETQQPWRTPSSRWTGRRTSPC